MRITLDIQAAIDVRIANGMRGIGAYRQLLAQVERPFLKVLLQQTRGNQSKAAKIAGMHRRTLATKLSFYGLKVTKEVKVL